MLFLQEVVPGRVSAGHSQKALTASLGKRLGRVGRLCLCTMEDADEAGVGPKRIEPGILYQRSGAGEPPVHHLVEQGQSEFGSVYPRQTARAKEQSLGVVKTRSQDLPG